jgi:hypothetical protein
MKWLLLIAKLYFMNQPPKRSETVSKYQTSVVDEKRRGVDHMVYDISHWYEEEKRRLNESVGRNLSCNIILNNVDKHESIMIYGKKVYFVL